MEVPVMTFEEFKPEFQKQGYKYVGLFSSTDEPIINFNNGVKKASVRMGEIDKRLKSKALPDGVYVIKCKNQVQKNVTPDTYYIQKGNPNPQQTTKIFMGDNGKTDAVLTYSEALKTNTELASANLKIEALESEISSLMEENAFLQEQLDQWEVEGDGLSETANLMSQGKDLLGLAEPIVTSIMDGIKHNQTIKYNQWLMQMQMAGHPMPPQPMNGNGQHMAAQPQREPEYYEDYRPDELELMSENDPDKYHELLNDYLARLKEQDPEAYEQVMRAMELQNQQQ